MDLTLDRNSLISILEETSAERLQELYGSAYRTKTDNVGDKVYLRALVEISNICCKNCLYCGIRSGNRIPNRYEISEEEVLSAARFAASSGYGSMVIQGGKE